MVVMTRETWTDGRMDEFKESVNLRFDEVNRRFDEVDKRFEQVDKRFEQVDKRFEQVDRQFAEVKSEIKELRQMMVQGFFFLVGLQATTLLTLVGLKIF
jgi:archaellum component FlaC